MRIVLHGQQAFGQAVLERLLERGEDVVAVCCAPTKEGKPEDPLVELAREKGLPVPQPGSWKTPEALADRVYRAMDLEWKAAQRSWLSVGRVSEPGRGSTVDR